jgi:hypothetical protein
MQGRAVGEALAMMSNQSPINVRVPIASNGASGNSPESHRATSLSRCGGMIPPRRPPPRRLKAAGISQLCGDAIHAVASSSGCSPHSRSVRVALPG